MGNRMRHTAIFQSAMLLALAALGVSAATTQTDFPFAAGVDSTGWAQAQSNADGHVLIESPQYPHGLWLYLVDETGDAQDGIQVEYQGHPDSLVAIRCVDPVGSVRETLVWSRPDGDPLRLTLKPEEASDDLPTGLASIDWQIDPIAKVLLVPEQETRLEGWKAVEVFLQVRWQSQAGRVAVQFNDSTSTSLAVEIDHPETIETLVAHLQQTQQPAAVSLGETTTLYLQIFKGGLALREEVILYIPLFFEDLNLEERMRQALGHLSRPSPIARHEVAFLTSLWARAHNIHSLVDLKHFTALQSLNIGGNPIVDLTPLAHLTNLTELNLSWCPIVDLTPLAHLTNLQTLDLQTTLIADLGPLAHLTNLDTLLLERTEITDLGPLAHLTNLSLLSLNSNRIEDLSPLVANPGLGEGDKVYLMSCNLLSDQALNEQIPALQARGVKVYL